MKTKKTIKILELITSYKDPICKNGVTWVEADLELKDADKLTYSELCGIRAMIDTNIAEREKEANLS
jgi:hypothetical protein